MCILQSQQDTQQLVSRVLFQNNNLFTIVHLFVGSSGRLLLLLLVNVRGWIRIDRGAKGRTGHVVSTMLTVVPRGTPRGVSDLYIV